ERRRARLADQCAAGRGDAAGGRGGGGGDAAAAGGADDGALGRARPVAGGAVDGDRVGDAAAAGGGGDRGPRVGDAADPARPPGALHRAPARAGHPRRRVRQSPSRHRGRDDFGGELVEVTTSLPTLRSRLGSGRERPRCPSPPPPPSPPCSGSRPASATPSSPTRSGSRSTSTRRSGASPP